MVLLVSLILLSWPAEEYGIVVDDTSLRQQAEAERCALLELLLVLSQRPGQRMPASQLRQLAVAFHARLFVVPRRLRPAGHDGADAGRYAVDLVMSRLLEPLVNYRPHRLLLSGLFPCSHSVGLGVLADSDTARDFMVGPTKGSSA